MEKKKEKKENYARESNSENIYNELQRKRKGSLEENGRRECGKKREKRRREKARHERFTTRELREE